MFPILEKTFYGKSKYPITDRLCAAWKIYSQLNAVLLSENHTIEYKLSLLPLHHDCLQFIKTVITDERNRPFEVPLLLLKDNPQAQSIISKGLGAYKRGGIAING